MEGRLRGASCHARRAWKTPWHGRLERSHRYDSGRRSDEHGGCSGRRWRFWRACDGVRGGTLTLKCPDRTYRFGDDDDLDATLVVRDERFFLRALTGSDIGIGESFMDGDWTTPDLVPLARLMLRNRRMLERPGPHRGRAAPPGRRHCAPPARQLPRRQPAAHPPPLRSRQRLLPPLPRRRAADVLVRLLRVGRRFARDWRRRRRSKLGQVEPALVARSQEPVLSVFAELYRDAVAAGRIDDRGEEKAVYIITALNSALIISRTLGNEYGLDLPDHPDLARFCLQGLGAEVDGDDWYRRVGGLVRLPRGPISSRSGDRARPAPGEGRPLGLIAFRPVVVGPGGELSRAVDDGPGPARRGRRPPRHRGSRRGRRAGHRRQRGCRRPSRPRACRSRRRRRRPPRPPPCW